MNDLVCTEPAGRPGQGAEGKPPTMRTAILSGKGQKSADQKGFTGMTRDQQGAESMENLLTIEQAAETLNFSKRTIQRWIGAGMLPVISFGHCKRIAPETLAAVREKGLPNADAGTLSILHGKGHCVSTPGRSRRKERLWAS